MAAAVMPGVASRAVDHRDGGGVVALSVIGDVYGVGAGVDRRCAGVVADGDRRGLLATAGVIGGIAGGAVQDVDRVRIQGGPEDVGGIEGVRLRVDRQVQARLAEPSAGASQLQLTGLLVASGGVRGVAGGAVEHVHDVVSVSGRDGRVDRVG